MLPDRWASWPSSQHSTGSGVAMGQRGPGAPPQAGKREQFARLIARGAAGPGPERSQRRDHRAPAAAPGCALATRRLAASIRLSERLEHDSGRQPAVSQVYMPVVRIDVRASLSPLESPPGARSPGSGKFSSILKNCGTC